jgi:hypothetical protein
MNRGFDGVRIVSGDVEGDSSIRGFIETDGATRMDPAIGIRRLSALAVIFERSSRFRERPANPGVKSQINDQMNKMAIPPAAIARAIPFAIEQPADVGVNEIVIRPTAQV